MHRLQSVCYKVDALSDELNVPAGTSKSELLKAMEGNLSTEG